MLPSLTNLGLPLADEPGSFWLPPAASTNAAGVDQTFDLILWVNYLYTIPVFGVLFYFAWKYRRRAGHGSQPSPHHGFLLEVTWTVIPTIMVVGIFFQGFVQYIGLTTMPEDPYEIAVTAKKWGWNFQYPGGYQTNELHVPGGRPILLTMRSDDVMHSLYIPAFRVKMDVIPGRYTQMWFEPLEVQNDDPTEPEVYDLFCTEYCGTGHSSMITKTYVHNAGYFDAWLADASTTMPYMAPCQAGEVLWERNCKQCHSVDGSNGTGPTWFKTYGTEQMTSAGPVEVDPNYLRESIRNPNAKIRNGYQGVMPAFSESQLSDQEIDWIIAYHKSLNPDAAGWTECVKRSPEEIKRLREEAKAVEAAAAGN